MPRYDVFLSHASADKPAVEQLARKLREAGIEPFLDIWCLVAGKTWQEELEDAVRQSGCYAVFFGPASQGGAWRNQETQLALVRAAREPSFRVIPVLLPQSRADDVPGFAGLRTWVDFREGLDDAGAFSHLIASIRAEPRGPQPYSLLDRYRCMAPAREPFVERSEYARVRDALLSDGTGASGRTTVGITTAIHGAGGFGKTALAIELCYDERVRAQYPDGILWTTMGEEIDAAGRLARVRDLIRWWTEKDPPAFETVSAASSHLRQELNGKRVLLVVDDVWRSEDVTPFQGLASLLMTTRDSRTLPTDSELVQVDALEISEAVRLLGSGLPNEAGLNLRDLATRLGEWPLLLKIVNRQLRELIQQDRLAPDLALKEVNEALDTEGLTVFDREDLESRGQAVAQTVGASLRRLSGEETGQFEQLAIFPEDKDVPLPVLEKLWRSSSFATKKLCNRLHDLSLLLRFDRAAGTIRLHDVIRAYLLKKGGSHLPEWHRRFLGAYRPATGRWADLPHEEGYLWNHLVHHLLGAGERDVCRNLLLDFDFLQSRLNAADVNALLADYSPFKEDDEMELIQGALRLSAPILAQWPDQLREQLWGRLRDQDDAGIQSLLQRAAEKGSAPWLRPRFASCMKPGRALIRTIQHDLERPERLAALNGHQVISLSQIEMLRVWDVETGKEIRLPGSSKPARLFNPALPRPSFGAVVALDGRKVVSGSRDGTLRVWDLESKQAPRLLPGERAPISALAVLDGRRVVSGSLDRKLRVWDLDEGRAVTVLSGPFLRGISAVAVLDSRRVVSGCKEGILRIWDLETEESRALEGHTGEIHAIAALDDRQVVSASADGTLRVWDVESETTVAVLEGHTGEVNAVVVLPGRRVLSGSSDTTLRLWNVDTRETLAILKGHFLAVHALVLLDSRRAVSASADHTLRVWDLEGEQPAAGTSHSRGVSAVAVIDHRRAVSASTDATLRIWDIEHGQPLGLLEGHLKWVWAVAALDDRRVVSGSSDGTLRLWDLDTGQAIAVLPAHAVMEIFTVAAMDGRQVIYGSSDGALRLWDVESGNVRTILGGSQDMIQAVGVVDSRRVLAGSYDGKLQLVDLASGEAIALFEDGWVTIEALAILGHRVASGFSDGMLRIHNVDTQALLRELKGHSADVRALAWLDDRRLVSGARDATLRIWNLETGQTECFFVLDAPVLSVAAVPGGRALVAGDQSGRVHFFDLVET